MGPSECEIDWMPRPAPRCVPWHPTHVERTGIGAGWAAPTSERSSPWPSSKKGKSASSSSTGTNVAPPRSHAGASSLHSNEAGCPGRELPPNGGTATASPNASAAKPLRLESTTTVRCNSVRSAVGADHLGCQRSSSHVVPMATGAVVLLSGPKNSFARNAPKVRPETCDHFDSSPTAQARERAPCSGPHAYEALYVPIHDAALGAQRSSASAGGRARAEGLAEPDLSLVRALALAHVEDVALHGVLDLHDPAQVDDR